MNTVKLFSLPELYVPDKPGLDWFVYYSFRNPNTGKMQRFRVYKGLTGTDDERRAKAKKIIKQYACKLTSGFDPFANRKNRPGVINDTFSIEYYIWDAYRSKNNWKALSAKKYKHAVKYFTQWLAEIRKLNAPVVSFDADDAAAHLQWLRGIKKYSARSANDHRGLLGTLFNIICKKLRKQKVLFENPFLVTPADRNADSKGQTPFNPAQVERIRKHLIAHDPQLWLACLFVRYAFVRTTGELPFLKIGDIDQERMKLTLRGEIAKNSKTQRVDLHKDIIDLMDALGYFRYPRKNYIFTISARPGPKPYGRNNLTKRFSLVRDKLNFGPDYSLYSFKHTGNAELHQRRTAMPKIRDQNRHSDIRTTDLYSKKYNFYDDKNVWD